MHNFQFLTLDLKITAMKNQYDAIAGEVNPPMAKKTWETPGIEIIGVESGVNYAIHESLTVLHSVYHS